MSLRSQPFRRRLAIVMLLLATATAPLAAAQPALAAPADQRCAVNAFTQYDMAGTFTSPFMNLEVYACGGSYLSWSNEFGFHYATYFSDKRLPGGGIRAKGMTPDPGSGTYLDGSYVMGVKPAEPGWVQLITINPYTNEIAGIYRLRQL